MLRQWWLYFRRMLRELVATAPSCFPRRGPVRHPSLFWGTTLFQSRDTPQLAIPSAIRHALSATERWCYRFNWRPIASFSCWNDLGPSFHFPARLSEVPPLQNEMDAVNDQAM